MSSAGGPVTLHHFRQHVDLRCRFGLRPNAGEGERGVELIVGRVGAGRDAPEEIFGWDRREIKVLGLSFR